MGTIDLQPRDLLRAFERAGDAVFAVDAELHLIFWNPAAERLFGRPAGDVLGRRCDDVIGGLDATGREFCGPDCSVMRCARRGDAVAGYELRVPAAAGETRWLSVSIIVLRGRGARSTVAVHLARDITGQRRLEVEANRSLIALESLQQQDDDNFAPVQLTRREADVLRLLACGLNNGRIAEALSVSRTTVRNHIEHVLSKLAVHSKLEAVVYAARHQII